MPPILVNALHSGRIFHAHGLDDRTTILVVFVVTVWAAVKVWTAKR